MGSMLLPRSSLASPQPRRWLLPASLTLLHLTSPHSQGAWCPKPASPSLGLAPSAWPGRPFSGPLSLSCVCLWILSPPCPAPSWALWSFLCGPGLPHLPRWSHTQPLSPLSSLCCLSQSLSLSPSLLPPPPFLSPPFLPSLPPLPLPPGSPFSFVHSQSSAPVITSRGRPGHPRSLLCSPNGEAAAASPAPH